MFGTRWYCAPTLACWSAPNTAQAATEELNKAKGLNPDLALAERANVLVEAALKANEDLVPLAIAYQAASEAPIKGDCPSNLKAALDAQKKYDNQSHKVLLQRVMPKMRWPH